MAHILRTMRNLGFVWTQLQFGQYRKPVLYRTSARIFFLHIFMKLVSNYSIQAPIIINKNVEIFNQYDHMPMNTIGTELALLKQP